MIQTLAVTVLLAAQDYEVEKLPLAWEELDSRAFDLTWCLPDEKRAPGQDLLQDMEELLALRFELPADPPLKSFGDLVAASWQRTAAERPAWLESCLAADPELAEQWGPALRQLLFDDRLWSRDWDPDEDDDRDGLLMGEVWDLSKEGAPWKELGVRPRAEQGALLAWADQKAWKQAENDYRFYRSRVGEEYEDINPVPGSYRSGIDPEGRPFSSLEIYFRCDLPFPFSDYACNLRILNRVDAKGRLVTDIYSTSKDFHWMAGRDVFLPVERSDGTWVANLVVRRYGFDLDGVPDERKHRQAALRSSLGNLRRDSEAIFRKRGASRQSVEGTLPEFRVMGRR